MPGVFLRRSPAYVGCWEVPILDVDMGILPKSTNPHGVYMGSCTPMKDSAASAFDAEFIEVRAFSRP